MKKFIGILITMAICLSMFCVPVSAYSDVKDNAEAIQVLSDLGILDGFEDNTFRELLLIFVMEHLDQRKQLHMSK